MVQFQNVSKVFPNGVTGIEDVSFTLDPGEFVFLIGPSGSGKTTLIEMLIRDQMPTKGKIYLDDTDITNITRRKIYTLRRQIGVIFQDFKLVPDKTAFENVAFAMEAAGKSNREIRENVPYLLEIVGLSHRMKSFPDQLSGGEQQRVAIARAIANNPRILIADEPTGNLDPASAWDIVQILTKINNWGTTVIMSTHGTDIVNSLNKRVIQMHGGKILRDDSEGQYEFYEEKELKEKEEEVEDLEEEKEKKSSLKINLTDKVKEEKATPQNFENNVEKGVMSRIFGIFGGAKTDDQPSIKEELQEALGDAEETESEENPEEKKSLKGLGAKLEEPEKADFTFELNKTNMKKAIKQVEKKTIKQLNLPKQIIEDLNRAGYKYISEIINDGLQELSEKLQLNKEETVFVAEAVEKYISKLKIK